MDLFSLTLFSTAPLFFVQQANSDLGTNTKGHRSFITGILNNMNIKKNHSYFPKKQPSSGNNPVNQNMCYVIFLKLH